MDRNQLIKAIEAYARQTDLAPATVTVRAVNNSRLYDRLVDGGDCTTRIAKRVMAYMADNPPHQGAT